MEKLLSWLIWQANSVPKYHYNFYTIKDHILKKYGQHVGTDIQHVKKSCYSCFKGIWVSYNGRHRDICWRCNGTGIYDEFWLTLRRFKLGDREFHIPCDKYKILPCDAKDMNGNLVEGIIKHDPLPHYKLACHVLCMIYMPKWYIKMVCRRIKNVPVKLWKRIRYAIYYKTFSDDIPF